MRALSQCRLEDIGKFDRLKVDCPCGRTVLLPPSALDGFPGYLGITDLQPRLRCDDCGERGKAIVSVVWASYASRRG